MEGGRGRGGEGTYVTVPRQVNVLRGLSPLSCSPAVYGVDEMELRNCNDDRTGAGNSGEGGWGGRRGGEWGRGGAEGTYIYHSSTTGKYVTRSLSSPLSCTIYFYDPAVCVVSRSGEME